MIEAFAEWLQHHPSAMQAMGAPLILFLGAMFFENDLARLFCAVLALCMMVAVTLVAVVTGQWVDLVWPGIGLVSWFALVGINRAFG